jgi:hypothetical protein
VTLAATAIYISVELLYFLVSRVPTFIWKVKMCRWENCNLFVKIVSVLFF